MRNKENKAKLSETVKIVKNIEILHYQIPQIYGILNKMKT